MKSGSSLKFIMWLLIGAGLTFLLWKISRPAPEENKEQRPIPVKTAKAELKNIPYYLSGIGTVMSPNQVVIRAQVGGELMALHFTEGQTVNKGDLLADIDPRPFEAELNMAKARKINIQAQLNLAKKILDRNNSLLKGDAISQQEVDEQVASVAQLAASLQEADASIAAAEVNLGYTKILSPISGRVGIRRVDAGNIVSANDTEGLVTITQVNPIQILFTLPQTALSQINTSGEQLPVAALDKDGGKIIANGKLETIDNQIDIGTGTIKLKASFDNVSGALWPGQHVTARLQRQIQENALVIPVQALQIGRDNNFVYRVKADKSVEIVPVQIIFQDTKLAVIGEGLSDGDMIVTDGQVRLKDGAKISTAEKNETKPDAGK